VLKRDRVDYWIGQGAQPSETVQSFLKKLLRPRLLQPPNGKRRLCVQTHCFQPVLELTSSAREGQMRDLIEAIAKALVDHPDQVLCGQWKASK